MNQTRREILKAMLLVPVAGMVPVTSVAAVPKPVAIVLPKVEPQQIKSLIYSETIRHFVLIISNKAARRDFRQFIDLAGRTNASHYRGFEPGSVLLRGCTTGGTETAAPASVEFDVRVPETAIMQHPLLAQFEMGNRASFAGLPDGKWFELPPSFVRRVIYVNGQGYEVPARL